MTLALRVGCDIRVHEVQIVPVQRKFIKNNRRWRGMWVNKTVRGGRREVKEQLKDIPTQHTASSCKTLSDCLSDMGFIVLPRFVCGARIDEGTNSSQLGTHHHPRSCLSRW